MLTFLNRPSGEFLSAQRVEISDGRGVGAKQFRIGNLNGLPAARFDRKDADLEKVAAGVLEQRRIPHFSNNVLINATRLVSREQLGFNGLAADFHTEFVDMGR